LKLYTHIIGSFGLASVANLALGINPDHLSYIFILSVIINTVIDLGHERLPGGVIMRSPYTHELFSCVALSTALGSILWLVFGPIYGAPLVLSIYASALIAISHLVGDAATRGGIYIYIGRALYRVSITPYSYRDPRLNMVFIAIQVLPLIANLAIMGNASTRFPGDAVERILALYGIPK